MQIFAWLVLGLLINSILDVRLTYRIYTDSETQITWEQQHKMFKRTVIGLLGQGIIVLPSLTVFVLHSLGFNFWTLWEDLDARYRELLVYHIITYTFVLVTGALTFLIIKYVQITLFDKLWQATQTPTSPTFILLTKVHALCASVAGICFCISLVRVDKIDSNSGSFPVFFVLLFSSWASVSSSLGSIPLTLFLLLFIVSVGTIGSTVGECLITAGIIFYTFCIVVSIQQSKLWWLAYRAVHAVHLFVAFVSFWICLITIVLVGGSGHGFWTGVDHLTPKRQAAVYCYVVFYILYILVTLYRLFLQKLRKRGRMLRKGSRDGLLDNARSNNNDMSPGEEEKSSQV